MATHALQIVPSGLLFYNLPTWEAAEIDAFTDSL